MKSQHRIEVFQQDRLGRNCRRHYVGTFKHSRVAAEVKRKAEDLLAARDMDAFAELMDRYVKNRTDDTGDGAQVA
jgi:hypothetical protein